MFSVFKPNYQYKKFDDIQKDSTKDNFDENEEYKKIENFYKEMKKIEEICCYRDGIFFKMKHNLSNLINLDNIDDMNIGEYVSKAMEYNGILLKFDQKYDLYERYVLKYRIKSNSTGTIFNDGEVHEFKLQFF